MHHLSIDLETYSSVPIAKAGAQKYISSPDFEILLFAYSLDGAPVEIVDLATGNNYPVACQFSHQSGVHQARIQRSL